MIAISEPTAAKATAPLYHLKVVLNETKPIIWRRLQVPGNATLGWLHAVLQVAMGWTNSHLHQFRVGELLYSDLRHNSPEFEGEPEILDENKRTLQQVVPQQKDVLGYEYDFGDSWNHQITVEKILTPDPAAATVVLCLDGARAWHRHAAPEQAMELAGLARADFPSGLNQLPREPLSVKVGGHERALSHHNGLDPCAPCLPERSSPSWRYPAWLPDWFRL